MTAVLHESGYLCSSTNGQADISTALMSRSIHPLPARPALPPVSATTRSTKDIDTVSDSNVHVAGSDLRVERAMHSNSNAKSKDQFVRGKTVELLDSWVAPDIDLRTPKRIKVKDVVEWDTWIAPEVQEEEQALQTRRVASHRNGRDRDRRRRGGRRSRREPVSFDTWIADPGDHEIDARELQTYNRFSSDRSRSPPKTEKQNSDERPPLRGRAKHEYEESKDKTQSPRLTTVNDQPLHLYRKDERSTSPFRTDKELSLRLSSHKDVQLNLSDDTGLFRGRDSPPHLRRAYQD